MSNTTALAIVGGSIVLFLVIVIAWYVILAIANWKLFTKAGEAGWKSLIPFYNVYTSMKLVWSTKMFWVLIGLAVLEGIAQSLTNQYGGAWSVIYWILSLAVLVIIIMHCIYMAKAYGKGVGTGILLLLFSYIVTLVLAFGSAQYVGPKGIPVQKQEEPANV